MAKERVAVVVDGGGRGHALVDKYAPDVNRLIAIPGNDAMRMNTDKPVELFPDLKTTNVDKIVEICQREIERGSKLLVDVAQDNAVAAGVVDALLKIGVPVIGPTRAAGQIEWSKIWEREFGQAEGLLQPSFKVCRTEEEGILYIKSQSNQAWFVKADGLTEGKGALPAENNDEAIERIKELKRRFPEAAQTYLI
ncbi:MAG: hypothetical protein HYY87_03870, partial [Candidatus Levybacteria bacterium]|nr:hypothetical protein [Candidatus Levybacteria bacterium]